MTKFLINKYTPLAGETYQVETVFHNLMLIGTPYKEAYLKELEETPLPYNVQICVCGRFITYIEISKNLKEGLMRFYDLKNDNDLALDAAKEVKERWAGQRFSSYLFNWFMEVFEMLKPVYEGNYDAAELFLVENAGVVLN